MRHQIKTSPKDFQNKRKAYPQAKDALKEIVTNAFFAPNVKNISLNFEIGEKSSFWFINDGSPMTKDEIVKAISMYGCESANTAGNENGMGLKCAASYFVQYFTDAMLVVASKSNGNECGIGWIDPYGNYCEEEDLSEEQLKFVKAKLATFENGTVTMAYCTKLEEADVDDFLIDLRNMFTCGLDTVSFVANVNGEKYDIYSFDRHYQNLDYVEREKKNVVFKFDGSVNGQKIKEKLFKCTLLSTNTRTIKPEDYKFVDEKNQDVIKDFGIHFGYDNGYMPIHVSQVEIIGYTTKPQYNYMRGTLIANPIEDNPKYANTEDWKMFFSLVGKMSQQKIPNFEKPFNYFKSDNATLKGNWKEFYEEVVSHFKNNINKWLPSSERNKTDKYTIERLDLINSKLEKQTFHHCDSDWRFCFGYNVDGVVKYDKDKQAVVFKFDDDSPLLKKLLKGGRNGRNGENDIETIILPTIDVFIMEIMACNTTHGVVKALKSQVSKFNYFYCNG